MNFTVSQNGEPDRRDLNCSNCPITGTYWLPVYTGIAPIGFYAFGEQYRVGEVRSNEDLTGVPGYQIWYGPDLTLIGTDRVRLLPGFRFSAADPQTDVLRVLAAPCGYNNP